MGYLNVSCEAEAAAASLARGREQRCGQSRRREAVPANVGVFGVEFEQFQLPLPISKPIGEDFQRCILEYILRRRNVD